MGSWAAIYFYFCVYLGHYYMLNLFVAIINEKLNIAAGVAGDGLDVFLAIDADGSGELDQEELGMIFLKCGVYMSEYELNIVFQQVDDDGGGTVSIEEFMNWLRGSSVEAAKLRAQMQVN